jgi:hypothetical protein
LYNVTTSDADRLLTMRQGTQISLKYDSRALYERPSPFCVVQTAGGSGPLFGAPGPHYSVSIDSLLTTRPGTTFISLSRSGSSAVVELVVVPYTSTLADALLRVGIIMTFRGIVLFSATIRRKVMVDPMIRAGVYR